MGLNKPKEIQMTVFNDMTNSINSAQYSEMVRSQVDFDCIRQRQPFDLIESNGLS